VRGDTFARVSCPNSASQRDGKGNKEAKGVDIEGMSSRWPFFSGRRKCVTPKCDLFYGVHNVHNITKASDMFRELMMTPVTETPYKFSKTQK